MKKTYKINTNKKSLELDFYIRCNKPSRIILVGSCSRFPNTNYFDTAYGKTDDPFVGDKVMTIKMPITPSVMYVRIYDELTNTDSNVILNQVKWRNLTTRGLYFRDVKTREFLVFAQSFCEQAGYLKGKGEMYEHMDGKYIIKYSDTIKDKKTGKYLETPARVGRSSGIVEISKKHFVEYSVPVRMMILCHEWSHWILNTRNEFIADKHGLKLFLSMGYPKTEAIYAFTKVFNTPQLNKEQEMRGKAMLNMLVNS